MCAICKVCDVEGRMSEELSGSATVGRRGVGCLIWGVVGLCVLSAVTCAGLAGWSALQPTEYSLQAERVVPVSPEVVVEWASCAAKMSEWMLGPEPAGSVSTVGVACGPGSRLSWQVSDTQGQLTVDKADSTGVLIEEITTVGEVEIRGERLVRVEAVAVGTRVELVESGDFASVGPGAGAIAAMFEALSTSKTRDELMALAEALPH